MNTIVNLTKLKGKMAESNCNSNKLAEMLDLSHTSISLKLNGKREFTDKEIYILATNFTPYILNLEYPLN